MSKIQKEKELLNDKVITKKNKQLLFFIILGLIIIVSVCCATVSLRAWARYTTENVANATAEVAQWHFELKDGITSTQEVDFPFTRTDSNTKVVPGKIAPGTYGKIDIQMDASNSETTLEYTLDVSVTNCPDNLNFYEDEAYTKKLSKTGYITRRKFIPLSEINNVQTETIYWKWPYETGDTNEEIAENDIKDSNDMGRVVSVQASVTAVQALEPTPLVPKIELATGEIIELTKDTAKNYYGKKVNYKANDSDTTTYRIFYVDFDAKYGRAGTIYLKADQVLIDELITSEPINDTTKTLMTKMNPTWFTNDENIDNTNEMVLARLYNQSNWIDYKGDKANYVIGAPSVEMYIDSYNEYYGVNYEYKKGTYGYMYSTDGLVFNNRTDANTIRNDNSLYIVDEQQWWFASPSAFNNQSVCFVGSTEYTLIYSGCAADLGLCPVVSIKTGTVLKIVE